MDNKEKARSEAKLLCADIVHTREKIDLALTQITKAVEPENSKYDTMTQQDLIKRITELEATLARVIPTLDYAIHITDGLSIMAKNNLSFFLK